MKKQLKKIILACLIVIACMQLCSCNFHFWNLEGTQISELGKLKEQQENGIQNAAATIGTSLLYQGISASCSEINDEIQEIEADYLNESGYVAVEDADSLLEAVYQNVKEKVDGTILTECSYTPGDSCVYMQFAGWIGVIYEPELEDTLSGDDEVSIYTFQPYSYQLSQKASSFLSGQKSVNNGAGILADEFDHVKVKGKYYDLGAANLQRLMELQAHSIILWNGHGGYLKKYGSFLAISDSNHDYDWFDQSDESFNEMVDALAPYLEDDSVFLTTSGHYVVNSKFFEEHLEDEALSGSLIYLNTCQSLKQITNDDGSTESEKRLAVSMLDKGAIGVIGNSGTVWLPYGISRVYSFCEGLATQSDSGNYHTIDEALSYAAEKEGYNDPLNGIFVSIVYRDKSILDLTMENFALYGTAEYVLMQKLEELVSDYGLFLKNQTGSMTSWQDEWFAPGGIMGAAIDDYDGDEDPEMLVCISEKTDRYAQDGSYHIMLYMWECEGMGTDMEAVIADSAPYGAYIQSEYREGNLSEMCFTASNWSEEIQAIHTVKVDDHCYLFCEDHELASAFADGSSRSYWLMSPGWEAGI